MENIITVNLSLMAQGVGGLLVGMWSIVAFFVRKMEANNQRLEDRLEKRLDRMDGEIQAINDRTEQLYQKISDRTDQLYQLYGHAMGAKRAERAGRKPLADK